MQLRGLLLPAAAPWAREVETLLDLEVRPATFRASGVRSIGYGPRFRLSGRKQDQEFPLRMCRGISARWGVGKNRLMERKAIDILDANRVMTVATIRPDGWPQATMVGYANEGLLIYFVISRSGQKFANIARDGRVSLAIGKDPDEPSDIKALSIAANVDEVRDSEQRERAIDLLLERHPARAKLPRPTPEHSAIMRAYPAIVTILDYSEGLGHADVLTVAPGGVEMTPARDDDWGYRPSEREEASQ